MNIQPARLALEKPVLVVVVDTEEEFDWGKPFDRNSRGTVSVPAQDRAHAVFDRYGIVPTYVMNHPVATSPAAVRYFRGLVDQGRAHVGTHCHPWVTPPHAEAVSLLNSFHGNLPQLRALHKLRSGRGAQFSWHAERAVFHRRRAQPAGGSADVRVFGGSGRRG